jgi:Spy/CpxP family protein refolding chaperone
MGLGLVIGAAIAVAVMLIARKARRLRRFRGFAGRSGKWGRGLFRRGRLYRIFERLDTTPGQEKAIRTAYLAFAEDVRGAREELMKSRQELAQAIRGAELDEAAITTMFSVHDELLGRVRRSALDGVRAVHEILDERQRRRLAEILETRMSHHRRGGPYRSASA